MKLIPLATLAFFMAFSGSAFAQSRVLELGHEASPRAIHMPTSDVGTVIVQRCPTCKPVSLQATGGTRYFLGRTAVSRADMIKYFDRNPDAGVVVMQLKGTQELSRIIVPGADAQ